MMVAVVGKILYRVIAAVLAAVVAAVVSAVGRVLGMDDCGFELIDHVEVMYVKLSML